MNIYALMTARGGSKSVPNKNITNVKGLPLYLHNVIHAKSSKYIKDIYISTDIDLIFRNAPVYDYKTIIRPEHLCGDQASHHETILHGVCEIEHIIQERVDIIVVLLGNSIGAFSSDLDSAIRLILDDPESDSVQSVSEFNMYNPFRAYQLQNGLLNTLLPQDYIIDRKKPLMLIIVMQQVIYIFLTVLSGLSDEKY